jgi:hypothetical protein
MIEKKTTNTYRFGNLLILAHTDAVGLKVAVLGVKGAYS